MKYPIVIHKDTNSDFGVIVPDLPGCFSAGTSFEDAIDQASEAILCHIEGLLDDNEPIPQPSSIEHHRTNRDYKNGTWAVVSIDLTSLSKKSKRVNITVPERFLSQLDYYAQKNGETRSGFLLHAAMEYISTHE